MACVEYQEPSDYRVSAEDLRFFPSQASHQKDVWRRGYSKERPELMVGKWQMADYDSAVDSTVEDTRAGDRLWKRWTESMNNLLRVTSNSNLVL